jgi:hypothetical protein
MYIKIDAETQLKKMNASEDYIEKMKEKKDAKRAKSRF